jgi:hypothetical protein
VSEEFNLEFVPQTGGSQVLSLSQALVSLGFQSYNTISSIDTVHALVFNQPVPPLPRWKSVDNSSHETTLALTRNHKTTEKNIFMVT